MNRLSRVQAVWLAALGAAALALYSPIWHGEFVYDDLWYIVRNPFMHQPLAWRVLFADSRATAAAFSGLTSDVYRPLTTLWFWLDAHLWGPNTLPYHLENLLLHLTNGALLFVLLRRWAGNAGAALAGTAFFLLHPVQVQSVAWITQRSSLASTTCLLGALVLFTQDSNPPRRVGGFVLAWAALLFRETPVVLPMLYALVVMAQRKDSWNSLWQNRTTRTILMSLTGLVIMYLSLRHGVLHQFSQLPDDSASWSANAALGVLAFPVYLGKILIPIHLRVSYSYPELDPVHIVGAVGVWVVFMACLIVAWRRDRWVAAGLGWILICLLPVLQIIPVRAYVAERFLYLPMVGAALVIARWATRAEARRFCAVWLLALAALTWRAVPVWMNEETLWADAVHQEPDNAFARLCYGDALQDPAAAYLQYRKVLFLKPTQDQHFMAVNNMANVLLQQRKYDQALRWARKAVAQKPDSPEALYNFARAAERTGRRSEALPAIKRLETLLGPESPLVRQLRRDLPPL